MIPAHPRIAQRRSTISSSSRDLAQLRVAPVDSVPLPRTHVEPRRVSGVLRLHDRPSGEDLIVYTPMFRSQFEAGHRAGRWYVRPVTSVGGAPSSVPFTTAREAIEAVGRGAWRLRVIGRNAEAAGRERSRLRIYWSSRNAQG